VNYFHFITWAFTQGAFCWKVFETLPLHLFSPSSTSLLSIIRLSFVTLHLSMNHPKQLQQLSASHAWWCLMMQIFAFATHADDSRADLKTESLQFKCLTTDGFSSAESFPRRPRKTNSKHVFRLQPPASQDTCALINLAVVVVCLVTWFLCN
jgi:hypothetical protein